MHVVAMDVEPDRALPPSESQVWRPKRICRVKVQVLWRPVAKRMYPAQTIPPTPNETRQCRRRNASVGRRPDRTGSLSAAVGERGRKHAGSGRRRLPALQRPPKRDKIRIGSGTYVNRCTILDAHNELHTAAT
jgi:hypothetical protein